ncbi:hypothetical protein PMSD_04940 [Paenibacillus macquariensis subsp. defensor]|nr:hypothetical protein PMSD_04940 [Paenibacillus macquariensis subsp. defensor]
MNSGASFNSPFRDIYSAYNSLIKGSEGLKYGFEAIKEDVHEPVVVESGMNERTTVLNCN